MKIKGHVLFFLVYPHGRILVTAIRQMTVCSFKNPLNVDLKTACVTACFMQLAATFMEVTGTMRWAGHVARIWGGKRGAQGVGGET
jgi:hypothetical protein